MEALADSPLLMAIVIFTLLFIILGSGIWIGIGLGLVGLIPFILFLPGNTMKIQGMLQFNIMNSFVLCSVPIFIFMGELMMRTGAANELYKGVTPFVAFLPGGLLHTNIASCAIFAAISGSSLATAATIGTPALPELLEKRKYDVKMTLGSLAAGGTLGILIPPSISMIIYGAWTNQSIGQLFIAGVFPGIILAILFMIYIAIRNLAQPTLNPPKEKFSLQAMAEGCPKIFPSLILIFVVLGTIYLGVATPTESAALGVIVSAIIGLFYRTLNWKTIREAALGTINTTAMITLIIVCAQMMSMAMSLLRIPASLAEMVGSLQMNRWAIMVIICLVYIGLGCVLEALSMMLLTLPVVFPIIVALHFDPIWFGVVLTILIEMAQVTPPVGINLYIIQGISGRSFEEVARGIVPFFGCQCGLLALVLFIPSLCTWLPMKMFTP